jgi:hypothetical protein
MPGESLHDAVLPCAESLAAQPPSRFSRAMGPDAWTAVRTVPRFQHLGLTVIRVESLRQFEWIDVWLDISSLAITWARARNPNFTTARSM